MVDNLFHLFHLTAHYLSLTVLFPVAHVLQPNHLASIVLASASTLPSVCPCQHLALGSLVELAFNLDLRAETCLLDVDYPAAALLSLELLSHFSPDVLVYRYATNYTFIFVSKLSSALVFLSAIRGGVPRYRYDFLTKMG